MKENSKGQGSSKGTEENQAPAPATRARQLLLVEKEGESQLVWRSGHHMAEELARGHRQGTAGPQGPLC